MKKILFLALAGAAIIACQKPGERVPNNGDTRSVSISIGYDSPFTRVPSDYAVVDDEAMTALKSGTLYFFNSAGLVVGTHTVDPSLSSFVVDNVSSAATSVGMIANPAEDLTAGAPATFAEFRAKAMGINSQASMSNLTSGTDEAPDAVQGIALLDSAGANTGNSANALSPYTDDPNDPNDNYTHTATINLSPAVARIEIAPGALRVGGTNTTGLLSFNLSGLYINNYSPTYTLGFAQASTLFGAGIQAGGNPNWLAAYDALGPNKNLFDKVTPLATVDATTGIGGYAYHVFPGAPMPHIIIAGEGFTYTGDKVDPGTRFWLIDEYYKDAGNSTKGELISAFQPGYVYRISGVEFGNSHPTADPYDKPVSVQVTVTISKWQLENTYVEPN